MQVKHIIRTDSKGIVQNIESWAIVDEQLADEIEEQVKAQFGSMVAQHGTPVQIKEVDNLFSQGCCIFKQGGAVTVCSAYLPYA